MQVLIFLNEFFEQVMKKVSNPLNSLFARLSKLSSVLQHYKQIKVSFVLNLLRSSCRVSTKNLRQLEGIFYTCFCYLFQFLGIYFALIFFVVAYIDNAFPNMCPKVLVSTIFCMRIKCSYFRYSPIYDMKTIHCNKYCQSIYCFYAICRVESCLQDCFYSFIAVCSIPLLSSAPRYLYTSSCSSSLSYQAILMLFLLTFLF